MVKPNPTEEQLCIRCNAWGPANLMQPLYRFNDPETGPWFWLHHHCAEIYSSTQFQAAMKRFESQVHLMAEAEEAGAAITSRKPKRALAQGASVLVSASPRDQEKLCW